VARPPWSDCSTSELRRPRLHVDRGRGGAGRGRGEPRAGRWPLAALRRRPGGLAEGRLAGTRRGAGPGPLRTPRASTRTLSPLAPAVSTIRSGRSVRSRIRARLLGGADADSATLAGIEHRFCAEGPRRGAGTGVAARHQAAHAAPNNRRATPRVWLPWAPEGPVAYGELARWKVTARRKAYRTARDNVRREGLLDAHVLQGRRRRGGDSRAGAGSGYAPTHASSGCRTTIDVERQWRAGGGYRTVGCSRRIPSVAPRPVAAAEGLLASGGASV